MIGIFSQTNKTPWISLIPVCAFLFYDFVQLNMMNSISPYIITTVNLSPVELGFISSLFFYTNLALLFPAGMLLDFYQPKWLIATSLIFAAIGVMAFALLKNISGMIMWRSFAGIAGAFSYISCVKILASQFPRKHLGLLLGLTGIIIMAAGVAAQYPLIWAVTHLGLTNTMWADGILGILISFLVIAFIKSSSTVINTNKRSSHKINISLKKENWLIAIYACLTNFPLFILGALWGNLYLQNSYHFDLKNSAFIVSMIYIGNMFGASIFGYISDRMKDRKTLMIACAILMLLSILLIMFSPSQNSLPLFLTLFFLLGISTGAQTLAYASIADINHQENIAKATSLLSILSVGGGAISQPLFGFLINFSRTENYQNGMYVMLLAAIIAVAVSCYYNFKSVIFDIKADN